MKLLLIFFLLPLRLLAQDITGVWTGTLYSDTTKQYLKYELAISKENRKLTGYSYTIFLIDNTENIGVKSIKVKNSGNHYFIEDDKLIDNNYIEPPARGVKTYSDLVLTETDSTLILSGPWKTNRTKVYERITGSIVLHKKKKLLETLIIPKLEQLGLANSLSFMQYDKYSSQVAIMKPAKNSQPNRVQQMNEENDNSLGENNLKNSLKKKKTLSKDSLKIERDNNISKKKNKQLVTEKNLSANKEESLHTYVPPVIKAAAEISSRKIETVRSVNIKNDSLLLTLYDNGEIDGDTVSVLMNGKVIWPMQGLTANGKSKTIYLTPEMGDSIELIMYAENLGSIPPNTGLLVVHDGDAVYEIRFSGDLKKNSAIILKRKKKR